MNFQLPDFSAALPVLAAAVPTVVLILIGALALNFVLCRALKVLGRRTRFSEQEMVPVYRVIRWVIFVAALVLILGAFGFNVGGLWGVFSTIFAMIAIGFVAVWSVLSNILCTLIIMIFRPFSVGDEIEFAGEPVKGRVKDLNFIYTTLDGGDGSVMQIPNNLFFQKVIRRRHAAAAVSPAEHLRTKRPDALAEPAPIDAAPAARS